MESENTFPDFIFGKKAAPAMNPSMLFPHGQDEGRCSKWFRIVVAETTQTAKSAQVGQHPLIGCIGSTHIFTNFSANNGVISKSIPVSQAVRSNLSPYILI